MSTRNDFSPGTGQAEPPSIEYRGASRHLILQRCFVWLPGSQSAEGLRCIAFNISTNGIALAVPMPLRSGTILDIKPWDLPDAPPLQARVVHAKALEFLWCCGCELIAPLSDKDLQAWLTGPRNWVHHEPEASVKE